VSGGTLQLPWLRFFRAFSSVVRAWGGVVVKALQVGRSRDRLPVLSLEIFSVLSPTEPSALRLTQPLKVSTRDLFWGKGDRCVWLTTYHPCSAETSRYSGALIYPEPLGPPRSVAGHLYFTLLYFTTGLRNKLILSKEGAWNIILLRETLGESTESYGPLLRKIYYQL